MNIDLSALNGLLSKDDFIPRVTKRRVVVHEDTGRREFVITPPEPAGGMGATKATPAITYHPERGFDVGVASVVYAIPRDELRAYPRLMRRHREDILSHDKVLRTAPRWMRDRDPVVDQLILWDDELNAMLLIMIDAQPDTIRRTIWFLRETLPEGFDMHIAASPRERSRLPQSMSELHIHERDKFLDRLTWKPPVKPLDVEKLAELTIEISASALEGVTL